MTGPRLISLSAAVHRPENPPIRNPGPQVAGLRHYRRSRWQYSHRSIVSVHNILPPFNSFAYVWAKSGLFVQPRYAKILNKDAVLERMGPVPSVEQPKRTPGDVLPHSVALPVVQESS